MNSEVGEVLKLHCLCAFDCPCGHHQTGTISLTRPELQQTDGCRGPQFCPVCGRPPQAKILVPR